MVYMPKKHLDAALTCKDFYMKKTDMWVICQCNKLCENV